MGVFIKTTKSMLKYLQWILLCYVLRVPAQDLSSHTVCVSLSQTGLGCLSYAGNLDSLHFGSFKGIKLLQCPADSKDMFS